MNNRLKRLIVLASIGGMAMAFGPIGWGCQPFAENQPYINFLDDVGEFGVAVGVDSIFTTINNQTLTDWFQVPTTNLYQDLWSSWVGYTFPEDPTFDTLLVN